MVELALPKNSRIEDGKIWTKIDAGEKASCTEFKNLSLISG